MRSRLPVLTVLALVSGLFSALWAADPPPEPQLVAAAKRGDTPAVARLLAEGANPNAADSNANTALIFAARDGHLGMARALLAAGATVNWQDGELVTPLILAAFNNHPEIVELLLAAGADPTIEDQWGRTALTYALRRGKGDPIAVMIREGR